MDNGKENSEEPVANNHRLNDDNLPDYIKAAQQDDELSRPGQDEPTDAPDNQQGTMKLLYGIEDKPATYLAILLGFQQYLTMLGSSMTIPYVMAPTLCLRLNDVRRAYILSTIFFVSGVVSLVQTTFGTRLPIIQGGSFTYFSPIMTILDEMPCPPANQTVPDGRDYFVEKMLVIQGGLSIAGLGEVILGGFGLVGMLLRIITPLAVAPTIALIGLQLFDKCGELASQNWIVAIMTIVLLLLFSQYLENVPIIYPSYERGKGMTKKRFHFFKLFPVLLGVIIMWAICGILTVTDALKEGDLARTDVSINIVSQADWFFFPYPGHYGTPRPSVVSVIGMLTAVFACTIESVGNYYVCARICGAPQPPVHAVNRGVAIEGLGSILSGLCGTCVGSVSYTENIGAIGITKVGSRRVIQWCSVVLIIMGILNKIGAIFVTVPQPVIAGLIILLCSMIITVGLSALHFIDLNSARNLVILGLSLFLGLLVPKWMDANKGAIKTGNDIADNVLEVLLSCGMLIGGILGAFLDNTIPGTDEERGIIKWQNQGMSDNISPEQEEARVRLCYDFPMGMNFVRRYRLFRYIPFSPTFMEHRRRNTGSQGEANGIVNESYTTSPV